MHHGLQLLVNENKMSQRNLITTKEQKQRGGKMEKTTSNPILYAS
jgi:hypothetical protein